MFQLQFILMLDADELQPMPVRRVRLFAVALSLSAASRPTGYLGS
jgi:hypothetical protein